MKDSTEVDRVAWQVELSCKECGAKDKQIAELENQVVESMGYVDDMIKDRDAFHDRNTELETRIEAMKCCGNCENSRPYTDDIHPCEYCLRGGNSGYEDNWQMKEGEL